jgi:membrane fusion protein (multidrug efflux system)
MAVNIEKEQQLKTGSGNIPENGQDVNGKTTKAGSFLKQKRILIPFFIILIAGIIFWFWYKGQLGYVSTDDAYVDGDKLSLASKMLGRITLLYADEGDNVTKGELLVRLDSTDLIAQRDQALISLKLAKDNIQLAQVNLDKAQQDFERSKQQYEGKIIPKEQYDHSQSALNAAQAEFNISNTKIGTAKAQLNVINTQLQNAEIYSPMNGVVAKRWVMKGDVVQPGQPIFSIYNLDSLWVTSDLQETDLASIKVGEDVEINVDSYPNHKFTGKVIQIGSNTASQFALIPPSNAAGNFTKITQRIPIKISIHQIGKDDSSFKLLPGMSVEVKIKVEN